MLVVTADKITNLQQTPETNSKVMLKVHVQDKAQADPVAHVFQFTSTSDARAEANAIKEALTNAIQAAKAAQESTASASGGSSAAMTIAAAISGSRAASGNVWEDDDKLRADVNLQESLMREDPSLRKTFLEARRTKPESISNTQFTAQFWSSRVHHLRAHAIAKHQARGSYNVFSSLKREEGGTKMSLSTEHIHLIFAQYPLMRRVYDEVVPAKYNEVEFWQRFFQSRLYMKLRGERILEDRDAKDKVLDQYLNAEEFTGMRSTAQVMHIPRIIDMEGNEENHSQRKGNRPDFENRQDAREKPAIIRTLNSLSEKLMAQVTPSDVDPSQPIGITEETYNNIRLRDLAADPEQDRIILKIRDQSHFFSDGRATKPGSDDAGMSNVDPAKAIKAVCSDMARAFPQPGVSLTKIGLDEDEDDDMYGDEEKQRKTKTASTATAHIMELVRQHRAQTEEIPASSGLPETVYERLTLTQATTVEFLSQFWKAFLSGDPDRVNEITSLVESLNRAMDRVKAIADDAEESRNDIIRKAQNSADVIFKRTGKKQKVDPKKIPGGAVVVNQLLGPTIKALAAATSGYQQAFQEQIKETG